MLRVYMIGLIYFNGCDEDQKFAFVPDGRLGAHGVCPHFASLWIRPEHIDLEGTLWPERDLKLVGEEPMYEFKMVEPAQIFFPDLANPLSCADLDAAMPKLKKEKKKDKDEVIEYFEIDAANARTIAKVEIRGGTIVPYDMKRNEQFGLVEWTIGAPSGVEITAGPRRIRLVPEASAEVILSNIHSIDLNANKDQLADHDHIQMFKQLNPALREDVVLVASKPAKLPEPSTNNPLLRRLEGLHFTCGETPPCCASIVVAGGD